MNPLLSIIIVNWNSAEYVRKCLRSIHANTGGLALEVIVVDNASYDGCAEMLKREFPESIFIQSKDNLGFARANNLGFTRASAPALLFLNPDTEVRGSALASLLTQLQTLPQAGAVGARLLNSDGTLQTSCIQSLPTVLNQALDCDFLRARSPRSRLWGMAPLFSNQNEAAEVEVISGACLMVKRQVFEQVAGFSEDYFMYSEDLDLCYKIRRAGFKNFYIPSALVVHHGGGSSRQSESQFSSVMMHESVCRFLRKTRGPALALAYRASQAAVAFGRLVALSLAVLVTLIYPQHRRRAISAFRKWLAIFRWCLGLESWVKKYDEALAASAPAGVTGSDTFSAVVDLENRKSKIENAAG